jgi:entry exclusion lipoprotein TrbK
LDAEAGGTGGGIAMKYTAAIVAIVLAGCVPKAELPPPEVARIDCENLTDAEVLRLLEQEQTDAATARARICVEATKD